ncbi:ER membrane protein complex subunit 8 [Homalodisca vitripennis]|uniref:ER membrane protein complex subunit 8 n=1 Tax=Homalodisca vitripennis TaxID=197043 RepID=UPI001EEBD699|nr:ER membrane protein complex subunit 8 [Homalodisca vitripennis]
MAEIKFTSRAYCKMILHAAKYPHCAVNGILLSECSKSKDSKKPSNIVYVDAVPLFHLCLHVSPMAEIALTQIDHWASTEGLVISGYYVANESIRDTSIEKPANRIADKIAEHNSSACLVVIDNRLLSLTMEEPALIVSQFADVKWKTLEKSSWSVPESCLDTAATLLERRWQENVIDFDNHLDDITLDWRNKSANSAIDTYSSQ